DRSDHQHPLRGSVGTRTVNGEDMEQWQYEVTGGGRLWYVIDDAHGTVWLTEATTDHPKATESVQSARPGGRGGGRRGHVHPSWMLDVPGMLASWPRRLATPTLLGPPNQASSQSTTVASTTGRHWLASAMGGRWPAPMRRR